MNCKHCGQLEIDHWGMKRHCVGKRGMALTIRATTYEPASPVAQPEKEDAAKHLLECAACNHGRTPCIEYQRVWPVASPTEPIIHVRPKVSEGEHLTSVAVAQSGAGASSSFPEMEVRATVALDSGDGGTRRACNNENCSQDYGHKGLCDRPSSPFGQAAADQQKYLSLLKWFKLFYDFFQKDIAGQPSACASALSEDSELQQFVKEAESIK